MNTTKYKFFTYLFLILSIFTVFLFSKNYYFNILQSNNQITILEQELMQKDKEYNELSKIQTIIKKGEAKDFRLEKFLIKFSEDELIDYFYSYAKSNPTKLTIQSISFSEGTINEVGFKEGTINLNVTFVNEKSMLDMLNFLIYSDKYNLYIHNFTYPIGNTNEQLGVSIPMKILYK